MLRIRLKNANESPPEPPEADEDADDVDVDDDDVGDDEYSDEVDLGGKAPAHCPFCARDVDSNLLMYGGQCPFCFGEIPGEEAPTDPGELKRRAELKAAKARVNRSKRVPMLIVGMFVMAFGCGVTSLASYGVWNSYQPMPALDLDDPAYNLTDLVIRPEAEGVETVAMVEPPETKIKAPKSRNPFEVKAPSDPGKITSGGPGTEPSAPRGSDLRGGPPPASGEIRGPSSPMETKRPGPGSRSTDLTSGSYAQRQKEKGVTLNDDTQIIDMAKSVVKEELPKLRYQCYERELKRDETLAGDWLLEFTVDTGGDVRNPVVTAKGRTDPVLEACIVDKVRHWMFQPIKRDLPIKKTVSFQTS